jgi:hypothetical protein
LSDQRAGDIVAVARALFDRIARRHPVALAIKQQPGEQARLVSAWAAKLGTVARKRSTLEPSVMGTEITLLISSAQSRSFLRAKGRLNP